MGRIEFNFETLKKGLSIDFDMLKAVLYIREGIESNSDTEDPYFLCSWEEAIKEDITPETLFNVLDLLDSQGFISKKNIRFNGHDGFAIRKGNFYHKLKWLFNRMLFNSTRNIRVMGEEVPVKENILASANILKVKAGTNGFKGGDSGHGGRTYFSLQDMSGTDMRVLINGEVVSGSCSDDLIEICLGGDCELRTFIEALEFAVNTYKQQIEQNKEEDK